ncbi:hypothetical protein A7Q01_04760 [Eikenella sp. NML96-A-049]|nr:hypothetical protein A7P97_02110 [Eikenella sp. NML070372]OAM38790.1 hypothetical protein A7Q01_04760 [Eikenella sp. NML96-A-049]
MILDPNLLSKEQVSEIVAKFQSILNSNVLDLPNELQQEDRIEFDRAVLNAFNIELDPKTIYDSLLKIYNIIKSVKDN